MHDQDSGTKQVDSDASDGEVFDDDSSEDGGKMVDPEDEKSLKEEGIDSVRIEEIRKLKEKLKGQLKKKTEKPKQVPKLPNKNPNVKNRVDPRSRLTDQQRNNIRKMIAESREKGGLPR